MKDRTKPTVGDAITLLLGGAFLLRGVAVAQKYRWAEFEIETSIFGVLLFDMGVSERLASIVDDFGVYFYVLTSVVAFVYAVRAVFGKRFAATPRTLTAALLACVGCELLMVVATMVRGGLFMVQWAPATHALRAAMPLTVWLLLAKPKRNGEDGLLLVPVLPILRVAIAATFVGHGVKALCLHSEYVTLLMASMFNLVGWPMSQTLAERILIGIGVADLMLASLMVTTRWRWVAIYMAAWGAITALSRVTAGGWMMWPELLLRTSHFVGPIVVLSYWYAQEPPRESIVSPVWERMDAQLADSRLT